MAGKAGQNATSVTALRRRATLRALLVTTASIASALGAGGGCSANEGSSGHGGSGGGAPIDEFIGAYCELTRTCCGRAGLPAEPLANCEAEVERQIDLISIVREGRATLIEPAYSQCLSTLRSLRDSCDAAQIGPGCERFWEGTVPDGGPCENVVECQLRSEAVACLIIRPADQPDATAGNCRALARGALGDPCLTSGEGSAHYAVTYSTSEQAPPLVYCDPRDGLWCSFTTNVCERLTPAGGTCDFLSCDVGLYCDSVNTCQPYKSAGQSCAGYDECGPEAGCVEGTCGPVPVSATKLCEGDYT